MNMINITDSKIKLGIARIAFFGVALGLMAIVAVFFQNVQASVPTDKIGQALNRLSQLSGQTFSSKSQAAAWCDTNDIDKLLKCETVGKEFGAYTVDQQKLVDAFLAEAAAIGDEIKHCQSPECFLAAAKTLSDKLSFKAPDIAAELGLTKKDIQDQEKIAKVIKSENVDTQQCDQLDSDTETTDATTLKKCYNVAQKLAKNKDLSKYLPAETDDSQGHLDKKIALSEGLANGSVSCGGTTTLEACGNYCLNPDQGESKDVSVIPQDCRDIAQNFFGPDGMKQLESAHSQVRQTKDFYAKKGQDLVFTPDTGDTLTDPRLIGQHCEQAGQAGNEAEAAKCIEFFGNHFQSSDADKKQALDLVHQIKEQGGNADFSSCADDPNSSEQCQKFLPPEQKDFLQVEKIMRESLGFDPRECQHRNCVEGSAKALDKLKALNSTNPQVQEIIRNLEQHINQAKKFNEIQNRPELRQSIEQARQECSVPDLTPGQIAGCIAKAAKFHIIDPGQAVQKFQQFNQDINQEFQNGPDEQGSNNQNNQSVDQSNSDLQNPQQQNHNNPPYPQHGRDFPNQNFTGPNTVGVSQECLKAIQSGDFVTAKTICISSTPPQQPIPSRGICPASPYFECPVNQRHDDYTNDNGCMVSRCVPIVSYPPQGSYQPQPSYSYQPSPSISGSPYPMDPATGCARSGGTWNNNYCQFPNQTYNPQYPGQPPPGYQPQGSYPPPTLNPSQQPLPPQSPTPTPKTSISSIGDLFAAIGRFFGFIK